MRFAVVNTFYHKQNHVQKHTVRLLSGIYCLVLNRFKDQSFLYNPHPTAINGCLRPYMGVYAQTWVSSPRHVCLRPYMGIYAHTYVSTPKHGCLLLDMDVYANTWVSTPRHGCLHSDMCVFTQVHPILEQITGPGNIVSHQNFDPEMFHPVSIFPDRRVH